MYFLHSNYIDFPNPYEAPADEPLAYGGDLSPQRLLYAYTQGIFPWEDEPLAWWSPDPRFVLFPDDLVVSKSMRPYFNQQKFEVTYDTQFEKIMRNCAQMRRRGQGGTWISENFIRAYTHMHQLGFAHSVEVWKEGILVGGLYGIRLGKVFFGESMFSKVSNASKFGFISYVQKLQAEGVMLIDCQQETVHLGSLGAKAIPRDQFLDLLPTLINLEQM